MAVKDGLPATDLSRQNREYVKAVVDGTDIPDGLPATDLSRMNREWIKAVAEEAGGGGGGGDITVEALTVTENDTYIAPEGKAYSPVIVNVPVGSGEFSLLDEITITEPSNALRFDFPNTWEQYDMIFIIIEDSLSVSDYIYIGFDTESPTHYTGLNQSPKFPCIMEKSNNIWSRTIFLSSSTHPTEAGFPSYMFMKAYNESTTIAIGSNIKIYGGKLS